MEPKYNHQDVEGRIYRMWEEGGYFTPKIDPKKKPFTILLPLPNASGQMHTGNILMIALEDILIRWHRMKGDPTLWLPGTDHAGTETQITFERELKKEGKTRFNFDRDSLYKTIWDFVQNNKHLIEGQIRKMGASVDWTRYKFSLDPDVVTTVRNTFAKLANDGLVYRDDYIVNYCPTCGTTYADIEVENKERSDALYYLKFGPFIIATTRPETMFRDTALAANPKDKRYKKWLGQTLEIPGLLGPMTMTVIADPEVDPKFGTGIMKVTPAHDTHDYQLGKNFNLPVTPIIDLNGRMDFTWFLNETEISEKFRLRAEKYHNKKAIEVRKLMLADLEEEGLVEKIDQSYTHAVPVCKAGHDIEPTVLPNWFIKVATLNKPAHDAVKSGKVKIYPKWREVTYHRWMENMHDWALSRQNVWGIRIPAWYDVEKNPSLFVTFLNDQKESISGRVSDLLNEHSLEKIKSGLQTVRAPKECSYIISVESPGASYLQETDTFDTWFSSGQWPMVSLGYPDSADFKYFYPTNVLETAWEILSKWVSRMIMLGIYMTGEVPFTDVYLHGVVKALDGRKMSKSLGNVINPEDYIPEFGVDALRMGLAVGNGNGHDYAFPRDKVIAYRNFANKVWNAGRFILLNLEGNSIAEFDKKMPGLDKTDKEIIRKLNMTIKTVDRELEKFRFSLAAEAIYSFFWHEFADKYVESTKERIKNGDIIALSVLQHVYLTCLKLLHPFMPFVTEEIWGLFKKETDRPLIVSSWPARIATQSVAGGPRCDEM
ncbi:MAG: valine--tRNA ligase [Patescibacteria group bacterium]|nr:valine--tRNA ligase [Patescibacteria group bacterium]MCL5431671.1 valine--tRNA ligase [Patescibacteria group bacterium]